MDLMRRAFGAIDARDVHFYGGALLVAVGMYIVLGWWAACSSLGALLYAFVLLRG